MTASFQKLSIANKLMMAPLLVAVLLVGFGIFSFYSTNAFQNGVEDLLSGPVSVERLSQETEATVNATHAAAYRSLALLNLRSDSATQSAEQMMTQQMTALDDIQRDLEASPSARMTRLIPLVKEYTHAVGEAYDTATSDTNLGAMMMRDADKASMS